MSTLGNVLKLSAGDSVPIGGLLIGVATFNGIILSFRYVFGIVGSPLVGHLLDHEKPDPGALRSLRGEEVLEDPAAVLVRAAGARVRDLEDRVPRILLPAAQADLVCLLPLVRALFR